LTMCRIVCHAVNVMLFDWGEAVMRKAAAGLLSMPEHPNSLPNAH